MLDLLCFPSFAPVRADAGIPRDAEFCVLRGAAGVCPDLPPPKSSQAFPPHTHHCTHSVSVLHGDVDIRGRFMTLTSMWPPCGVMTSSSVRCLCGWRIGVGRWAQTLA